jgi:DNA polymerase III epsilon subunit-like protein
MSKRDIQLVCVDFETNGLTLKEDSLSISIRLLNKDGTPTNTEFYSLIHTKQKLNPKATAVKVIEKFFIWHYQLGNSLLLPIGHNFIAFDLPRLKRLFGPIYNDIFHYPVDSLLLAQYLKTAGFLKVKSCSLDALVNYFKIKNPHPYNVSGDTWATGMVYSRLVKIMNPDLKTRIIRVFYPKYSGCQ